MMIITFPDLLGKLHPEPNLHNPGGATGILNHPVRYRPGA